MDSIEAVYGGLAATVDIEIAGGTFKCRHCDQNSTAWAKVVRRLTGPYKALLRRDQQLPVDMDREITVKAFIECCLVGWADVRLTANDPEIPYSADEALKLFKKYPRLFSDIMTEAMDMQRFRASEIEAIKGN